MEEPITTDAQLSAEATAANPTEDLVEKTPPETKESVEELAEEAKRSRNLFRNTSSI